MVERIRGESDALGFNAATGKWKTSRMAGIIDPAKVARSALQNAASIAGLVPPRSAPSRRNQKATAARGSTATWVKAEARRRIERGRAAGLTLQTGSRRAGRKHERWKSTGRPRISEALARGQLEQLRGPAEPASLSATARPDPRRSTAGSNSRSHSSAPRAPECERRSVGPGKRARTPFAARALRRCPPRSVRAPLARPVTTNPLSDRRSACRAGEASVIPAEPPGQVVVARPPLPQPLGRRGGA